MTRFTYLIETQAGSATTEEFKWPLNIGSTFNLRGDRFEVVGKEHEFPVKLVVRKMMAPIRSTT
jgi:hypothetical protein